MPELMAAQSMVAQSMVALNNAERRDVSKFPAQKPGIRIDSWGFPAAVRKVCGRAVAGPMTANPGWRTAIPRRTGENPVGE